MSRLRPGTLRGRVVLGAVAALALGLGVLVLAFNLLLAESLRRDVDSSLQSRADAALTTVSQRDGRLITSEGPGDAALDSGVWVYEGARAVEQPPASAALQQNVSGLVVADGRFATTPDGDYRLHSVPVVSGGRRAGTVVVAGSLAAYDRTTDLALVGSLLFAAAVLVAIATVMWLAVGGALRPVETMTSQAADWGDHDLDRRFGPAERPEELQQLAATFDGLLDRVAASLRHEQRLSAELSHELRTPLARIAAQAEILGRRPHDTDEQRAAAELTLRSTQRMTAILDTLMTAARAEARESPGVCDAGEAARRAVEAVDAEAHRRGVTVSVSCPRATKAGADTEIAERILAPLLENAVRFAHTAVAVQVARSESHVVVDVHDDGPGIPTGRMRAVFEPGATFAPADMPDHDGAGLGLPLARRLARAAGGDVEVLACERGAHLRIRLPAG